jgi:uncharacterized membrane protein (UPF0127 family)
MTRAGALVAAALALACSTRPPLPPAGAPRARVHTAQGVATVELELARTDAARELGLMHRTALAPDAGMLFVFDGSARHGFWMRNTLIPLDMLFLSDDGRVLAVVQRQPLSLEVTDGGVESRYVLEVNAGWAQAHGVARGDQVTLENVLY